jgi:hypothetical protein
MTPRTSWLSLLAGLLLVSAVGRAAPDPDAGTPPSASSAPSSSAAPAGSAGNVVDSRNEESCVERIPSGKDRPQFREKIASRAISGHALTLEVTVLHGRGETVLPTGFRLLSDSAQAKALEREGFALPDPEGAAGPKLERTEQGYQNTAVAQAYLTTASPRRMKLMPRS